MTSAQTLNTIFIAANPKEAQSAEAGGADLIMVDLEVAGKHERQKNLSAHMSQTSWDDLSRIRDLIYDVPLMVRLDPWLNDRTPEQIDRAISMGADRLMLPMIEDLSEVAQFATEIAGRVAMTPLIETIYSVEKIYEIASLPEVDWVHIGLNDLHLQRNDRFLFEPLSQGVIDQAANDLGALGKPFGIGGIGTLSGNPPISPDVLLGEHARLGSSWVILSRQFRDLANVPNTIAHEIDALKNRYVSHSARSSEEAEQNRVTFVSQVEAFLKDRS